MMTTAASFTDKNQYQDAYGRTLTVETEYRRQFDGDQECNRSFVSRSVRGEEFSENELRQVAEYLLYTFHHSARRFDEEYDWVRETFEPVVAQTNGENV